MKKFSILCLTLLALGSAGFAVAEVCTAQASWCGTIVGAVKPVGGSCHTNSHDKAANAVSYDSNGNIYDIEAHTCGIGPC